MISPLTPAPVSADAATDVSAAENTAWELIKNLHDIPLADWVIIPALLVGAYAVARAFVLMVHPVRRFIVAKTQNKMLDHYADEIRRPLVWLLTALLMRLTHRFLHLQPEATALLNTFENALFIVAGAWLMFRAVDGWVAHKTVQLQSKGQKAKANVMPMVRRGIKIFLGILFIITLLQNFGVNVGALLAGLGIGGIAIALAGQKTVENLFGGVMLILDQPVKVGDYFKSDTLAGTVEDIGLRSTRIRTLDRTVITVPNADLAQLRIENYAKRERIRLLTTLGLRYETSPDQMRWVLVEIKKMLLAHKRIERETVRVRFVNFGAYSLDIELLCYVLTDQMNDFYAVREDILLRVMDIVNNSGTGFAFPSQTLYMGKDDGLNKTRTQQAEREVAAARKKHELLVPAFPDSLKDALQGTLDWPPHGSAVAPIEPDFPKKPKGKKA